LIGGCIDRLLYGKHWTSASYWQTIA
jgi:hypothetical protein